ncbi:hypothetical protein [Escherichia coli]|nr:hypothetical protein [Escherichia coli]
MNAFKQLHQSKDEVFERGVLNAFRGQNGITKPIHPVIHAAKLQSTTW